MTENAAARLCLANVTLPQAAVGLPARPACVTLVGGRISAVSARPAADAPVADLQGASLLPGFIDAHTHLEGAAADYCTVNWTTHDKVGQVRVVADRLDPDCWILGGGWSRANQRDQDLPTLAALDEVTGDRPLALTDREDSLLVLNSAALRRCRIVGSDGKARVRGVELDDRGTPTGRLTGTAARGHLAAGVIPPVSTYVRLARLRALLADLTRRGITEVHDIATYPCEDRALPVNLERSYSDLRLIDRLQATGELPVRVGYRPPLQRVAEHEQLVRIHAGDNVVFPAGYKLFLDDGWYDVDGGTREDEFRYPGRTEAARLIRLAEEHGASVSIHACGDRGVSEAVSLLDYPPSPGRPPHRIIHARRIRPADIERCAKLGVVIETQPWEIIGMAATFADPRFKEVKSLISPYQSLLAAGVTVAFSSDRRNGMRHDLRDADPLTGIQIAITRAWHCDPQQPDEQLTAEQAVSCATRAGAAAAGKASRRGEIRAGADADLVILDRDPRRTDPEQISELQVLATITAGRVVHDAAGFFG